VSLALDARAAQIGVLGLRSGREEARGTGGDPSCPDVRSLAPPASDQAPVWPPPGCAISNGISLVRLPTRPSTVPPGRSHSPSLCTPPFLLLPASVPHVPSRQGLLPPSPGPGAGTSPQDFILLQVSKAGPRGSPLACVLWEWTRPLGWIRHPSCLAHTVCLGF